MVDSQFKNIPVRFQVPTAPVPTRDAGLLTSPAAGGHSATWCRWRTDGC